MGLLKDSDRRDLENGYYAARGGLGGKRDLYEVRVSGDTFTAESWEGFLPINDFRQAASNFSRIDDISCNLGFVAKKLG